jgi:transcriptional regulator with XRE-family HTH domain
MIIHEKQQSTVRSILERLRKERGLKQKQVAAGIGICEKTYSAKEQGRADLSTDEIRALCQFYQIKSMVLLGI